MLSISFSLYFYSHTFGLRIVFHLTNKFIYSSSAWSCTHLFDLLFYVSLSIFHFPSFSFKAVCCSIKKSHDYFAKQKKKLCAFSLHIRRFHQFPNIHVTVQHGVPNKRQEAMNFWITNVSANRFEVCLQESTTFSGLHDKLSVVCKM